MRPREIRPAYSHGVSGHVQTDSSTEQQTKGQFQTPLAILEPKMFGFAASADDAAGADAQSAVAGEMLGRAAAVAVAVNAVVEVEVWTVADVIAVAGEWAFDGVAEVAEVLEAGVVVDEIQVASAVVGVAATAAVVIVVWVVVASDAVAVKTQAVAAFLALATIAVVVLPVESARACQLELDALVADWTLLV